LLEIFAPVGQVVSAWCTCSNCYKVIFQGANSLFSWVGSMHVRWGVLEFGIVLGNEGFNFFGDLVVQFV
jgi:hypothetical protein